jgi:hypothetical protein
MPTVRPAHIYTHHHIPSPLPSIPPRSPRLKPTTSKLIRSRSGSASIPSSDPIPLTTSPASPAPSPDVAGDVGSEWLGKPCKFEIVQEQLQIEGYQMYAVEKWYAIYVF